MENLAIEKDASILPAPGRVTPRQAAWLLLDPVAWLWPAQSSCPSPLPTPGTRTMMPSVQPVRVRASLGQAAQGDAGPGQGKWASWCNLLCCFSLIGPACLGWGLSGRVCDWLPSPEFLDWSKKGRVSPKEMGCPVPGSRMEPSPPPPKPPRCLWTFVRRWTATVIMQEWKLRLEVVPDLPECHNKWVMSPKWPPLPQPHQGG